MTVPDRTVSNRTVHTSWQAPVEYQTMRLDRRRQRYKVGNVWYNAAVRSPLHTLAARLVPLRTGSMPARHN